MALPAAVLTVGQRAFTYAAANLPAVAEKAKDYLSKANGGKPVEAVLANKNQVVQQAVVKALFDNGLDPKLFVEGAQLTADEARAYAQLIAAYHVKQAQMVDERQTAHPTTGDNYLDRLTTNRDIGEIITILGITSDQYAKIVRGINTHTTKDIEMFQLDRRVRGERYA